MLVQEGNEAVHGAGVCGSGMSDMAKDMILCRGWKGREKKREKLTCTWVLSL